MPQSDYPPTLPERLLQLTGLRSWPLASLGVGLGFCLLYLAALALEGKLVVHLARQWRPTLFFPTVLIYLLLIQAPLRHLLDQAIEPFLSLIPATEHRESLVSRAYSLNRIHEWVAFILSVLFFWFIVLPGKIRPEGRMPPSEAIYGFLGGFLVFGLTGWHIYSGILRTKILTRLYSEAQDLNLFKRPAPFSPILRWVTGVVGGLLGTIVLGTLFLPPAEMLQRDTLLAYVPLIMGAMLVIAFGRVPASLFTRVSMLRVGFLFLVVAVAGTLGFNYFEGWPVSESLYATIITMTTVGYGDLSPVTIPGRYFTIALSLVAVGIAGYAVSAVAAFIVEGNFNRLLQAKRIDKEIDELTDHIILCGVGRVGKQVALEFYKTHVPFVVIEKEPATLEELLRQIRIPYVEGDATQDEVLEGAGIGRARGLVTALSDDKDNVFVVLSARESAKRLNNHHLTIISRVNIEKQRQKLKAAGADITISTHIVGGRRMAGVLLRPETITFLDEMTRAEQQTGYTLRLEDVYVDRIKHPILVQMLEQERLCITDIGQHTGLMVVAIKRPGLDDDDPYLYTPRGSTRLQRGDVLIVIGTPQENARLKAETSPGPLAIWQTKLANKWNLWRTDSGEAQ